MALSDVISRGAKRKTVAPPSDAISTKAPSSTAGGSKKSRKPKFTTCYLCGADPKGKKVGRLGVFLMRVKVLLPCCFTFTHTNMGH